MKLTIENSRIIKPYYEPNTTPPSMKDHIPLTVFDKANYDTQVGVVFAYHPPTPPNAAIELGLRKALSIFRPFAGRFGKDKDGEKIILLNDEGVKFIEASVDAPLDETTTLEPFSPTLEMLHPSTKDDVDELAQVQLTRFSCGSLLVGWVSHHLVADAQSGSSFLAAWGQSARGVEISQIPLIDRNNLFAPREVPQFDQFEHRGVEYMDKSLKHDPSTYSALADQILVHKVRYPKEFIAKLKSNASSQLGDENRPYSTFESLVSHVWRTITKARGLDEDVTTYVKISVNGRMRIKPNIPNYFGNLVLWALPTSTVKDLINEPISYAAKLIHDSLAKMNDEYFASFIDFANYKVKEEELIPTVDIKKRVYTPNVIVDSWLKFPFYDLDFGTGFPFAFTPANVTMDGFFFLLPPSPQNGSVDVFVSLFKDKLETFKEVCYSLD
ncbi:acetyltransferase [Lithospermum erythrorhizon]|uniref:Acetyltransferase n=1 Tax=Lithospermum erythrorhizon TaxID=34254 RepID=A0AAV3Q2Z7_LITER